LGGGGGGGFIDDILAASVPRGGGFIDATLAATVPRGNIFPALGGGGGGGFIDDILAALGLSWWDISEIPILVPYGAVDAYFCCQSTVGVVEVEHSFLVGQQSESNIHFNQYYSYILTVNNRFEKPHKTNASTKIHFM
jgi:hypothetical protein